MAKKKQQPVLKEQEAIEYLMTYGWALLLIAVGFLSVVFVTNTVSLVAQQGCAGTNKIQCLVHGKITSTISTNSSTVNSTTLPSTSIIYINGTSSTILSTISTTANTTTTVNVIANTTTVGVSGGGKIYGVVGTGNLTAMSYAISQGVSYFRFGILYNNPQRTQLTQESSQGINILGIGFPIVYTNGTLDCVPTGSSCANWNLTMWNNSVVPTLQSYPYIHIWEIDNEPLSHPSGFNNGSAYNYFLMIKGAATKIRQYEPSATIVCFGGSAMGSSTDLAWSQQVWSYGASQYCDAISLHAYPGAGIFSSGTATYWASEISQYEAMTGKPIWITETGTLNNLAGYNTTIQATFLNQSFSFFSNQSAVQRIYWYNLYGLSDVPLNRNFGLLNLTVGPPYPAWYNFLNYAK